MYRMMTMHYNTFILRGVYLFGPNTLRYSATLFHKCMIRWYVSVILKKLQSSFWLLVPLSHIKKIDYKLNAVILWTKHVFHFYLSLFIFIYIYLYLSFILGAAIDYMVRKIHTVDVYIVIYVCSLVIIYHFLNLIWYIFIIT